MNQHHRSRFQQRRAAAAEDPRKAFLNRSSAATATSTSASAAPSRPTTTSAMMSFPDDNDNGAWDPFSISNNGNGNGNGSGSGNLDNGNSRNSFGRSGSASKSSAPSSPGGGDSIFDADDQWDTSMDFSSSQLFAGSRSPTRSPTDNSFLSGDPFFSETELSPSGAADTSWSTFRNVKSVKVVDWPSPPADDIMDRKIISGGGDGHDANENAAFDVVRPQALFRQNNNTSQNENKRREAATAAADSLVMDGTNSSSSQKKHVSPKVSRAREIIQKRNPRRGQMMMMDAENDNRQAHRSSNNNDSNHQQQLKQMDPTAHHSSPQSQSGQQQNTRRMGQVQVTTHNHQGGNNDPPAASNNIQQLSQPANPPLEPPSTATTTKATPDSPMKYTPKWNRNVGRQNHSRRAPGSDVTSNHNTGTTSEPKKSKQIEEVHNGASPPVLSGKDKLPSDAAAVGPPPPIITPPPQTKYKNFDKWHNHQKQQPQQQRVPRQCDEGASSVLTDEMSEAQRHNRSVGNKQQVQVQQPLPQSVQSSQPVKPLRKQQQVQQPLPQSGQPSSVKPLRKCQEEQRKQQQQQQQSASEQISHEQPPQINVSGLKNIISVFARNDLSCLSDLRREQKARQILDKSSDQLLRTTSSSSNNADSVINSSGSSIGGVGTRENIVEQHTGNVGNGVDQTSGAKKRHIHKKSEPVLTLDDEAEAEAAMAAANNANIRPMTSSMSMSSKPPLSPTKMMTTLNRNSNDGHHPNQRVNSIRSRRLLWGGQLLQPQQHQPVTESSTNEEEENYEFDPDEINIDYAIKAGGPTKYEQQQGQYPQGEEEIGDKYQQDERGGLSMVRSVDDSIQEATWKNQHQNPTQKGTRTDCMSIPTSAAKRDPPAALGTKHRQSSSSRVHWPPPTHPDSRPAVVTPTNQHASSSSGNVAMMGRTSATPITPSPNSDISKSSDSVLHYSPQQRQQQRLQGSGQGQGASLTESSPTRSDHSADNAAGIPRIKQVISRLQHKNQVRRHIAGPLGRSNGSNHEAGDTAHDDSDPLSNVDKEGGSDDKRMTGREAELTRREDLRDDVSLDHAATGGRSVHAIYRQASSNSDHNAVRNISSSSNGVIAQKVSLEDDNEDAADSLRTANERKIAFPRQKAEEVPMDEGANQAMSDIGHYHRVPSNSLEAKLASLAMIGRSKTFDSTPVKSAMSASQRSGNVSPSVGSANKSVVSAQPSVESACVRQNAEMFTAMEGMMDFFVQVTENNAENGKVQATQNVNVNDGVIMKGGADAAVHRRLPSVEEMAPSFDETPHHVPNHQALPKPEYTSFQQPDSHNPMPASPEESICKTPLRGNSVSRAQQQQPNMASLIMPSPSAEYDDPSLFDNSLFSEASSELTPAPPQARGLQLRPNNKQLAANSSQSDKNLGQFFDQFNDQILRGCQDGERGDGESSDVFLLNESQFSDNHPGTTSPSFVGQKFGDNVGQSHGQVTPEQGPNTQLSGDINQIGIDDSQVPSSSSLNKAIPLGRTGTLTKAAHLIELDESSSSEEDIMIDSNQQHEQPPHQQQSPTALPPASTFLSAKERARIRQHDRTPLRANTTRARMMNKKGMLMRSYSYGETSMCQIKEDDAEESGGSTATDEDQAAGLALGSIIDDKPDRGRASQDAQNSLQNNAEESANLSDGNDGQSVVKDEHIKKSKDPPAASDGNLDVDSNNANNDGPNDDGPLLDPVPQEFKMSFREKRKGHSLAWHSSNGVNEDELYDSKQMPGPLSSKGKSARAARLNLFSISAHTAGAMHQHFHQHRQDVSPLYKTLDNNNDAEEDDVHLGLIWEESFEEDNNENDEDDESTAEEGGRDSRDDEYSYDDFVREFKYIISNEKSGLSSELSNSEEVEEVRETESMSDAVSANRQPLVGENTSTADSTTTKGSDASSSSRFAKDSNASSPSRFDRDQNPQHEKQHQSTPPLPPTPNPNRLRSHLEKNNDPPSSNVIAPAVPKKSDTASIASSINNTATVSTRFQMQHDKVQSVAQRRADFSARARRSYNQQLNANTSGRPPSHHNQQQPTSTLQHCHPHHVPKDMEYTRGRLEEKLLGIRRDKISSSNINSSKKDSPSVGTSELGSILTTDLGSLLTKESDRSRIIVGGLPIPSMIFHRTHPADSASARSSPSSMQYTYNASMLGGVALANAPNCKTKPIASSPRTPEDANGCHATTEEIASNLLLPTDDDDAPSCCHNALQQSPTMDTMKVKNGVHGNELPNNNKKENHRAAAADAIAKIDGELLRSSIGRQRVAARASAYSHNRVEGRMTSAPVQKGFGAIESNIKHAKGASTRSQVVRGAKPIVAHSSTKVSSKENPPSPQKENQILSSNMLIESDANNERYNAASGEVGKIDRGQAQAPEMPTHNSVRAGNSSRAAKPIAAPKSHPSSSSNNKNAQPAISEQQQKMRGYWSLMESKSESSQSHAPSNISKTQHQQQVHCKGGIKQPPYSSLGTSAKSQQKMPRNNNISSRPQIPGSFNKKSSVNVNVRRKLTDDASQHSSIFEAFEVAPLQTIANDSGNNLGNTRVSLNDFGVHHAYVNKGAPKKVGFPVTRQSLLHDDVMDAIQPPTPATSAAQDTPQGHGQVAPYSGMSRQLNVCESPSQDPAFEVTLQHRNLRSSRSSGGILKKRPPISPTKTRKLPGSSNGVAVTASSLQKNQVEVSNSGKNSNSSQFRKIRSGWKKMVSGGNGSSGAPSSKNSQRGMAAAAPPPRSSTKKPTGSTATKPSLPPSSSKAKGTGVNSKTARSGTWVSRRANASGKLESTQRSAANAVSQKKSTKMPYRRW